MRESPESLCIVAPALLEGVRLQVDCNPLTAKISLVLPATPVYVPCRALTVYELATARKAFSGLRHGEIVTRLVMHGARPTFPVRGSGLTMVACGAWFWNMAH